MARNRLSAEELVETPDHIFVDRILTRLNRRDPPLKLLLVNAAVPRKADLKLLAELTSSSIDDEFMGTFQRLTQSPYVKMLDRQSVTVHDEIRRPILALWEQHGFGSTLDDARQTVLGFWRDRYLAACLDEEALDQVGGSLQEADPSRFRSARRAIRRGVDEALVELVNSSVSVDPSAARGHLDVWFNERAERRDFTRCDLLSRAFADCVLHLEDHAEVDASAAWSLYYRSVVREYFEDWQGAANLLEKASARGAVDSTLALWIQDSRARILIGQNRLIDAQAACEKLISMNELSHADPWNEHVAHERLASVLSMRWHAKEAAASHRAAIDSALAAQNVDASIAIRVAMAADGPDRTFATGQMIQGIVDARLRSSRPSTSLRCARGALVLFGSASPRLASLFSQQVRQLSRGTGESAVLELLTDQADALQLAGMCEEAIKTWDRAIELASEVEPTRVRDFMASRATLLNQVGRAREAAAINCAGAEDPLAGLDLWHQARCTTNAAFSFLKFGDAEAALRLAERAHGLFSTIGNDRAATLTWIIRANAYRILADFDQAEFSLTQAFEPLPESYEADRQMAISRLAAATDRPADSAEAALRAYTIMKDHTSRLQVLPLGAEVLLRLTKVGRFDESARLASEMQGAAQRISEFGGWLPSEATTSADGHAAEALRIWKAGIGDEKARLRAAREHLREAMDLDPQQGWISLEAGLVDRASGDRKSSDRRFKAAIDSIDSVTIRDSLAVVFRELSK